MYRLVTLFLLASALPILSAPAGASVIYVSGDQTGTWAADTVIVTAEVRVPPGESLTIQPGVEVLFSVYCKLIVDSAATLQAIGSLTDSIRFDVLPPDTAWHGIRFLSASDASRLEYCILTQGYASGDGEDCKGGAIYCSGSSPAISHNTICENSAYWPTYPPPSGWGGGIYCQGASPTISCNNFSGNSVYQGGGAICCVGSNPDIRENIFGGNSANYGGAISCDGGSPSISNNTMSGNLGSGVIHCNDGSPRIGGNMISQNLTFGIICGDSTLISNNIISENSESGIFCAGGSPSIIGNTISENEGYIGGGIRCEGNSSPVIIGNTISGNSAFGPGGGAIYCESSLTLHDCILWDNMPDQIYGTLLATYCNIQDSLWPGEGNISVDPLFVNPDSNDYHLQSTVGSYHGGLWLPDSLHSPCIDAGDPGSPFALEPMPNGGRINMGFEGNTAEASLSTGTWALPPNIDLPKGFCLYAPHPNPFNSSTAISYELPVASFVSLRAYDTAGRLVAELVNGWRQAGNHQITFDAAEVPSGIYFANLVSGGLSQMQKLILLK